MAGYRCIGCGTCCRTMLVQMKKDDKLTPMRIGFKREFIFNNTRYAVIESVCKHLVGNRCRIYDRRPQRCKDFPEGEAELWGAAFPECGLV